MQAEEAHVAAASLRHEGPILVRSFGPVDCTLASPIVMPGHEPGHAGVASSVPVPAIAGLSRQRRGSVHPPRVDAELLGNKPSKGTHALTAGEHRFGKGALA